MFDIGFWELTVIAVVALIVIGPDKLPEVARTAGKWAGRTRRFVNQVRSDIDSEIKQEDVRKFIEKEVGLGEIKDALATKHKQYDFEEEKSYLVGAIDDAKNAIDDAKAGFDSDSTPDEKKPDIQLKDDTRAESAPLSEKQLDIQPKDDAGIESDTTSEKQADVQSNADNGNDDDGSTDLSAADETVKHERT